MISINNFKIDLVRHRTVIHFAVDEAAQMASLELVRLSNKSGVKIICKSLHPVLIYILLGIPAYLERGLYMKIIDGYPLGRDHEPAC